MKEPAPGLIELRVVWLALLGGVVVYAGTVWFILSTGSVTLGALQPGLLTYVGPALVASMGGPETRRPGVMSAAIGVGRRGGPCQECGDRRQEAWRPSVRRRAPRSARPPSP